MGVGGYVSEIFGSFQGEGPFIGERHLFLRLGRCGLGCAYCDTPASQEPAAHARFEEGPGWGERLVPNPVEPAVAAEALLALEPFPGFSARLSVTGGEPLEQPEFLKETLMLLAGRLPVLLETNGVHAGALAALSGLVDVVSMDIKLPSVSGLGPMWDAHAEFLSACRGCRVVVKAVVSSSTPPEEVSAAASLVAGSGVKAPFIIQPITGPDGMPSAGPAALLEFYMRARPALDDVRVIPQVHRVLGVR